MKMLIFVLTFLFGAWLHAEQDPEAHLHDIETARQQNHDATSAQMAQLNFFRMRLLAFEDSIARIEASSARIKDLCGANAQTSWALCRDQIDELYTSVNLEQGNVRRLETSSEFVEIIQNPFNENIHLEKMLQAQRKRLNRYSDKLFDLRVKTGKAAANDEFEQMQFAADKLKSDFSRQFTCKLTLPTASALYVSAALDLRTTESAMDPFLILRAKRKLRQVNDEINSLTQTCPEVDTTTLKGQVSSVDLNSWDAKIPVLFSEACAQVGQSDAEASQICTKNQITGGSVYYLHTVLARMGGAK